MEGIKSNIKSVEIRLMTMEGAIRNATKTVGQFFDSKLDIDKQVPISMLKNAKGLAFLTVVKVGFIWTGKMGTGLVISKLLDGRWSAPSAIGTVGIGFGLEGGGEIVDFMIVLSSEAAVRSFMQKGQLSVGTNLELAAGPYGRAAGANASLSGSGVTPNYTYSHSKGLFGGVGLQGSGIAARNDINTKFYGREITPTEILTGAVDPPPAAHEFYDSLQRASRILETSCSHHEPIPTPVSGQDFADVYDKVMVIIHAAYGKEAVDTFQKTCKMFGQDTTSTSEFLSYLRNQFTAQQLKQILPDLVKLLPQKEKRKKLWDVYMELKLASDNGKKATSLF